MVNDGVKSSDQTNPFVFIVGCPRSGTTLLERMVNAHPQLAIIHETHWITRFRKKRIGVTRDGFVTPELVDKLVNYHRFHLLKMTRADIEGLLEGHAGLSYAEFVTRVFELYGRQAGKPLVGDKTTGGYLRNLPILRELFPKAKLVHLHRDGRDVCLSMMNWPKAGKAAGRYAMFEENPVATTALWWAWQVGLGVDAGKQISGQYYYQMRYEELVRLPSEACIELCSYLNIPFDETMLKYNQGRASSDPSQSANQAWLSPTPGIRDWRTQMKQADVELFEALAGDVLETLGYEIIHSRISPAIRDMAAKFASKWNNKAIRGT